MLFLNRLRFGGLSNFFIVCEGIWMNTETKVTVAIWRSVRKEHFPDGTVVNGKAVAGVLFPSFAIH